MISKKITGLMGFDVTRRTRSWFRKRLASRGLILMYHRVSETDLDPWGLNVTPDHFAEQLDILEKSFNPLPLDQLLEAIQEDKFPDRAVVITFDDGYADNLYNAKPLLEQRQLPAVVFLITDTIGMEREFWWDELGRALLQPERLPPSLHLKIEGQGLTFRLGSAHQYAEEERKRDRSIKPWEARQGSRLAFFYQIWQQLIPLSPHDRGEVLGEISQWAGAGQDPGRENRSLSPHEAKELERGGLIELGVHTATHPSLPNLSTAEQMAEIQLSKAKLEAILGRPAISFSYPHGDYTAVTAALIREAGFHSACTTNAETVWRQTDPFQLPRFQVEDWNGKEFERRLLGWFRV